MRRDDSRSELQIRRCARDDDASIESPHRQKNHCLKFSRFVFCASTMVALDLRRRRGRGERDALLSID